MSIETTPWGFAEAILGESLYDWQGETLDEFDHDTMELALLASNGSGKTQKIIAPLVWWFGSTFSGARIVTTSATHRQVESQMWDAILQKKHLFPTVKNTKTTLIWNNGSTAEGFSTDEAGRFEGYHKRDTNKPLLIIVDESKSILDPIYNAIDRCQASHVLYVSSSGKKTGRFYKMFTNPGQVDKTRRIIWKDCPHITQEWHDKQVAKYGISHPFIRSSLYSEFYGEDGDVYVIPSNLVEELRASKIVKQSGLRFAFVDVAAGGDETVVAVMEGNFIHTLLCFVDSNTNSAVNRIIAYLKEMKVPPERTWIDSGGIGHPMADNFDRQDFPVGRVNNGSKAFDKAYFNRGAEIWWDARKSFEDRKIILPDDEVLIEQLSGRLIDYKEGGKLGVESKADMRERGLSSPDRADAVCGVISMAKYMPKLKTPEERMMEEFEKEEIDERRGWHTG